MMSDLCTFFYIHGAKKTNQGVRILFDFGEGIQDLGFDLKHFREELWKVKKILRHITVYGWNTDTLWRLAGIFEEFWHQQPKNKTAQKWLFDYGENNIFSELFPPSSQVGVEEIDIWLERVWQVWTSIVINCRKFGIKRDDLENYAQEHRTNNIYSFLLLHTSIAKAQ